jgi:rSAM/selenodomain-associated transferase 1
VTAPALIVLAKEPLAGRVKTRLSPPCTPQEAAAIAAASLADTLDAVSAAPASRRVLVLDGSPGRWVPDGVEVLAQRGDGLAERLAAAFDDVGGPALLVGMDTPQLTAARLAAAGAALTGADAVLGPAIDGGYWGIGLRRPDARVFAGIPMSTATTCVAQRARLRALGLDTTELEPLRDVDRFADAVEVAADGAGDRFRAAVAAVAARHAPHREELAA